MWSARPTAVHLERRVRRHRRVRQVRRHRVVRRRDRTAVQLQCVGRDAQPVAVPIARLHHVLEHLSRRRIGELMRVGRVPRRVPDLEGDPRPASRRVHGYGSVEVHARVEHFAPRVRAVPRRRRTDRQPLHLRGSRSAAVHLVRRARRHRVVRQNGGRRRVARRRDRAAVQLQGVRPDAQPVRVRVPSPHHVAKFDVRLRARRAQVRRVARRVPHLQRDPRPSPGRVHRRDTVEADRHLDPLASKVRVPLHRSVERRPSRVRSAHAAAVHLVSRRKPAVRQRRGRSVAQQGDRAAVRRQPVRLDADAVRVPVSSLHDVTE